MTITVRLFGHYRDVADALGARDGALVLDVPREATVTTVALRLMERDARLADLLIRTRMAVSGEFAIADTPLRDGDDVAFLPPMSGG